MKRYLVAVLVVLIASGCASGLKRTFTIVTDPPDAEIKVISGSDLETEKYRSPAEVTVYLPQDSRLLVKNVVEVSKETYKPKKIQIRDIREGEKLMIKLDKAVLYRLTYRLISPALSEGIAFQDKIISVAFTVADQGFQMKLSNLAPQSIKILWDRAEYTDVNGRAHRLMHSGIRPQDRNNPIPGQTVPPRSMVQQAVMPITSVVYSQEKKGYENLPLFPVDSDTAASLKGRAFYLFIPIEVDRQIIPYNFKIEITEAIKT